MEVPLPVPVGLELVDEDRALLPTVPPGSPWPSPSRFSVRAMTGPATGDFQTPVWTVRPRQATSRGIPTLTETVCRPTCPPEYTRSFTVGCAGSRTVSGSPHASAPVARRSTAPARCAGSLWAGPGPARVDHHRALHGPTPRCRGSPGADRCDGSYRGMHGVRCRFFATHDAMDPGALAPWSRRRAGVAVLRRAHAHPRGPYDALPGRGRAAAQVPCTPTTCSWRSPRRRRRPPGCGWAAASASSSSATRSSPPRRSPASTPLRRAAGVRRRRRLEPRGDAEPRHRPAAGGWRCCASASRR